jgi:hypothetical protein
MGEVPKQQVSSDDATRMLAKELGQLTEAVSTLRKRLDRIFHIACALGGMALILFGLLVFMAHEITNTAITFLRVYSSQSFSR